MKHFCVLALAVSMPLAAAADDLFARDNQVAITLHDRPCERLELVVMLASVEGSEPLAAAVALRGKHRAACWVNNGAGSAIVIDEVGGGGVIPLARFKRLKRSTT